MAMTRAFIDDLKEKIGLARMVGKSPVFLELVGKIPVIARSDAAVLLRGETGTGKEVVARAIHYLSPRSAGPFVPVNCGAIPADLMESELFGHERSAFTGAHQPRAGLIEDAGEGTLFLDEVDSLPALAQAKLLRFLQDKEFRRLGSTRPRLGRTDRRLARVNLARRCRSCGAGVPMARSLDHTKRLSIHARAHAHRAALPGGRRELLAMDSRRHLMAWQTPRNSHGPHVRAKRQSLHRRSRLRLPGGDTRDPAQRATRGGATR